jgi:hypothetical protein
MAGLAEWWRARKRESESRTKPTVDRSRWSRANEAYETGRWEEAAAWCQAIFDDAMDPCERRFIGRRAASSYRRAGDLGAARRLLRTLMDESPEDVDNRRELARLDPSTHLARSENEYWHKRQHYLYIHVTKEIARRIAGDANSVLDVGSNGTPILSWFPNTPTRVSVDLRNPYAADGVVSFKTDFLTFQPPHRFDVGLCLQVLEHVRDASAFARHLLGMCDVVIVSVSYRWPHDASSYHFHDPVDERKMKGWFGREPNYTYRVVELDEQERLICVYDNASQREWRSVDEDRFRFRWSLRGVDELLADEGT